MHLRLWNFVEDSGEIRLGNQEVIKCYKEEIESFQLVSIRYLCIILLDLQLKRHNYIATKLKTLIQQYICMYVRTQRQSGIFILYGATDNVFSILSTTMQFMMFYIIYFVALCSICTYNYHYMYLHTVIYLKFGAQMCSATYTQGIYPQKFY